MAEIKKVPAIRFNKFADDWVENELDNLFSKIKNAFVGTATPYYVNEGHFYLESNNVKNGQINRNSEVFINDYFYKKQQDNLLHTGDIVMVQSGHVGHSAVIPPELNNTAAHALIIFADKKRELCSYFLNYQFQTDISKKEIASFTTGNTIKHILSSDMKKFRVLLPDVTEQTQIGSYFQQLDKLIRLHQTKVNKLTNLKKAMLEKMFPKQGADVPEIRFKGFAGAWDQKEINAIADRYDNLRIPITAANRTPGPVPYYGANGIQDYVDGYTHEGEFILIAEDGANDLKNYPVQYVNGKVWVNNHAHVLQGKNKIANNLFLKYAFSQVNIEPFLVGGGRAKLNAETMMKIEMPVPESIDEQEKIGTYFQNLDKSITLHQTELEKLNNLKKACLEKMFV